MYHFIVVTLFPEMLNQLKYGITGKALRNNLYRLTAINPRHYSTHPRGYVDEKPYGGGPGMVISAPPIDESILAGKKLIGDDCAVINLSPHGYPVQQKHIEQLHNIKKMIFICGRYEGIDQRAINLHATHHLCLADIVLSGGELPALACMDAIIRGIPGALSNRESLTEESFQRGMLDYPVYTKPEHYKKTSVPTVLLSGDHARIKNWRQLEAKQLTEKFRAGKTIEDKKR